MMPDFVNLIKTEIIDRLDYHLLYISITILLFFYGLSVIRKLVKSVGDSKTWKFIIFSIFVLFGVNALLFSLVNLITSMTNKLFKWLIILVLFAWSFYKFDHEVLQEIN